MNRPWRPVAAGRLTPEEANGLLRILIPTAMALSVMLRSLEASVALIAFTYLYNDLQGNEAGPFVRNALNGAGIYCFGWGTVLVLLENGISSRYLDDQSRLAVMSQLHQWLGLSTAAVASTVHAQDFVDYEGDKARGRRTMPLVYGQAASRLGLAFCSILWSIICLIFWSAGTAGQAAVLFPGVGMACLVLLRRDPASDQIVWFLWCAWLVALYALPLFQRV